MAMQGVGIGLRQPHYAQVLQERPVLGFVEVHSENFFADGGAALGVLMQARERHGVSLHGVGLGLGSAAGVDPWHLDRLARLVQRIEPLRVSDHACFARAPSGPAHAVVHGGDLLPIAFTRASLDIFVDNVMQVQERLRRPMLVENLSAYLSFETDAAEADLDEAGFFAALCRRAGCGMLLDVNNLMVNALNASKFVGDGDGAGAGAATIAGEPAGTARAAAALRSCTAFIDALPPGIVGELHVAGHSMTGGLVIDDHGSRVRPGVWALCRHAVRRFGAVPILVEWDSDLPSLEVLLGEARSAASLLNEAVEPAWT